MQRLIKFKFIKKFRLNKIQLIIGFLFLLIIIIISQRTLIYKYTDTFLKNLGFLLTEINISGISKLNENEIKTQVNDSVKFAEDSPYPSKDDIYKHIYEQGDYPFLIE